MGQSKSYGILAIYIKLSSRRCQLTVKVLAYPIVNYIAIISGITLKVRIKKDVSLTLMLFAIFLDMDVSTGTMHLESFIKKVSHGQLVVKVMLVMIITKRFISLC